MVMIQLNALRLNAVDANIIALDGVRRRGSHAGAPPVVPDVPDIPEEPDVPSDPEVDENGYIIFADPEVKRVLLSNGVGDGVGITKEAAAQVKSIGYWFRSNKDIQSFDELRFFTQVKSLEPGVFMESSINRIDLSNVTRIDRSAFADSQFSGDLIVPNLTYLAIRAFRACNITRILDIGSVASLPDNTFYEGTFYANKTLSLVILPPSITGIYDNNFVGCLNLETVILKPTTPPTSADPFYSTNDYFLLYVPDASVEAYRTATGWSTYASRIFPISQLSTDNPDLYNEIKDYL